MTARSLALTLLLTASHSAFAVPVVMDFQGAPVSGALPVPVSYAEDGFQANVGIPGSAFIRDPGYNTISYVPVGSQALQLAYPDSIAFRRIDGGVFDAVQMIAANGLVGYPLTAIDVRAYSDLAGTNQVGGGLINSPGPAGFQSFTAMSLGYSGIRLLLVSPIADVSPGLGISIDSIEFNVAAVPEPSTVVLVATGILGSAWGTRRRKRQRA